LVVSSSILKDNREEIMGYGIGMRGKDVRSFLQVARQFQVIILVRHTNEISLKYVTKSGFQARERGRPESEDIHRLLQPSYFHHSQKKKRARKRARTSIAYYSQATFITARRNLWKDTECYLVTSISEIGNSLGILIGIWLEPASS